MRSDPASPAATPTTEAFTGELARGRRYCAEIDRRADGTWQAVARHGDDVHVAEIAWEDATRLRDVGSDQRVAAIFDVLAIEHHPDATATIVYELPVATCRLLRILPVADDHPPDCT